MREKLQRFMLGRNGNDKFNTFLFATALILIFISTLLKNGIGRYTYALTFAVLGYAYYRMLSRNISRRREENGKYLRLRYKLYDAFRLRNTRWVQRKDYKFFSCPSCKTVLRVPRGHGKINIVCRKCGNSFTGRT